MRLVLVGDVMLGRLVNRRLATVPPEFPWGDTLSLLRSANALIINLECVISDRGEPWPKKIFTFRSDPKNVAVLTAAGVAAVSLANNHSMDYGPDALQDCLDLLVRHGIRPAGAGPSIEAARRAADFWAGETHVACVAFTDNEPAWEAGTHPGVLHVPLEPRGNRFDRLLVMIDEAKRVNGLVVVSAHWGPNWGYAPLEEHVRAAHLFIEAGADIIFGHSPHVVRGIEIYRDRPILYGCGDFIDDYAVDEVERNDESGVFCLDYEGTTLQQILLVPTMIERFRAMLARGTDRERFMKKVQALCASLHTDARVLPEGLQILLSRRRRSDAHPAGHQPVK